MQQRHVMAFKHHGLGLLLLVVEFFCRRGTQCLLLAAPFPKSQQRVSTCDLRGGVHVDPMVQGMGHGFETAFVRTRFHDPSRVLDRHALGSISFQLHVKTHAFGFEHPGIPGAQTIFFASRIHRRQQHGLAIPKATRNPSTFTACHFPPRTTPHVGARFHFHGRPQEAFGAPHLERHRVLKHAHALPLLLSFRQQRLRP